MGRLSKAIEASNRPSPEQTLKKYTQLMRASSHIYEELTTHELRFMTREQVCARLEVNPFKSLADLRAYVEELHRLRRVTQAGRSVPFAFNVDALSANYWHPIEEGSMVGLQYEGHRLTLELIEKPALQQWLKPTVKIEWTDESRASVHASSVRQLETPDPQLLKRFKALANALHEKALMPNQRAFARLNTQLQAF